MKSTSSFKGTIAEVRLFSKTIQPVMYMCNPLNEDSPHLVGHWNLLGPCDQIILDFTKNHNNGTLGDTTNEGSDDPQCVKMEIPVVVPAKPGSSADWVKSVMIRKLDAFENQPRSEGTELN